MSQKINKPTQALSDVKVEQLNKQPIIESFAMWSEDKNWLIHKTIITDIKPKSYVEKVLGVKIE